MAGTALKKRAMRILGASPHMSPRELQEVLGCCRATAFDLVRAYKDELKTLQSLPARPMLELVKGTSARTAAEDLPQETKDLVVDELQGMMLYVQATRRRMMAQHGDLRPIEHSQFATALASVTKAIQTLCDTYPGLAQLTSKKLRDDVGFSDADLGDVNAWLSAG